VSQLRADVLRSGPPILLVEIGEIACAFLLLVEVAYRDIQTHWAVTESGQVEYTRFYLQARLHETPRKAVLDVICQR
jgi:hypothetical protein